MPNVKVAAPPAAWACLAVVAVLSLTPSAAIVRTGMGGHAEHAVAYAGTAFLTAAAYGSRIRIVAALLVYAGILELLQHFSPGRTPSVVDYIFSAGGIGAGVGALALLCAFLGARKPFRKQSRPGF
jgi:VanZ family protein